MKMKIYYHEPGITIYHGDALKVLPGLSSVDLLLTDPPYGVNFGGKSTTKVKHGGYISGDDPTIGYTVVASALLKVKRGVVFTGIRQMFNYPEPADVGCVFNSAGNGRGRWGFTCFNPVLFYGKRPPHCFPSSLMSYATSEINGHPCPKPIEWMIWAVNLGSVVGETILDPFMGSGTTLVAAKQLGRKAIGIELEEKYCEIAVNRIRRTAQSLVPTKLKRRSLLA
jgi:site-specific DNA-methyltransferase (adenine-specific)